MKLLLAIIPLSLMRLCTAASCKHNKPFPTLPPRFCEITVSSFLGMATLP